MEAENIIEANEQLANRIAELTEENKGLLAKVEDQKAQLNAYEADYDELTSENEKLKAQLNTEDDESDSEEELLEAEDIGEELVESEEAVDPVVEQAKATADIILKKLGHQEPIGQPSQEVELSHEQAVEEYGKIADANERSKFYAQHRELIFNN